MCETVAETERITVRELGVDDVPAYKRLIDVCDEGIDESLKGLSEEEFLSRHKAYIKYQYGFYGYGNWGLFLKDGTFIGIVGVHNADESFVCEIGYALLPEYRRKGYVSEACRELTPYILEDIGFNTIIARTKKDNPGSIAIAEKFGYIVKTV